MRTRSTAGHCHLADWVKLADQESGLTHAQNAEFENSGHFERKREKGRNIIIIRFWLVADWLLETSSFPPFLVEEVNCQLFSGRGAIVDICTS